jgi:hypothetical protein
MATSRPLTSQDQDVFRSLATGERLNVWKGSDGLYHGIESMMGMMDRLATMREVAWQKRAVEVVFAESTSVISEDTNAYDLPVLTRPEND